MKKRSEMMKKLMVQILVAALLTFQMPTAAFAAEEPPTGAGLEETVSGDKAGAEDASGSEEGSVGEERTVSGEDIGAEDPAGSGDQEESEEPAGNGGGITTWSELQAAITAGGEIILTQDIVAGESDSALTVPKSEKVTIDLNGHKIDRHLMSAAANGYVIRLEQGESSKKQTELTVKDSSAAGTGMITGGNNSNVTGGGVYAGIDTKFILESGSISSNEATSGGGVCVIGGKFIMKGGRICDNKVSSVGGGVDLGGTNSSFTMDGGTINKNTAEKGGGVNISDRSGCSFTMNDGMINNNTAKSGGGVCNFRTFTMNGGVIAGNASNDSGASSGGGGVYNYNKSYALFNMNGGIIRDNTCNGFGGGVFTGGKFNMYGGDLTGNKSVNNGGGVYIFNGSYASFHISGNVAVSGNKQNETTDNVHMGKDTQYIYIDGKITEGSSVGVTSYSAPDDSSTKQVTGNLNNNDGDFSFLFSDKGFMIKLDEGNARLYLSSPHDISTASVSNGTLSVIDGKTQASAGETVNLTLAPDAGYETASVSACYTEGGEIKYVPVTGSGNNYSFIMPDAAVTVSAAFTPGEWKNLEILLNKGGTVTLQKDITAKDTDPYLAVLPGTIATLDLNGHTLDRNLGNLYRNRKDDGYVIKVQGNLTVTDSSQEKSGRITGGNNKAFCGGVYVDKNGRFTLDGGSISGNIGAKGGGGVYVSANASFTMNSGTITGNNNNNEHIIGVVEDKTGGGVYVAENGVFTLNGGSISGNIGANGGGGVYVGADASFTMNSGTITGNDESKGYGGGVYVHKNGSFELNGGEITENTAVQTGGVYVETDAEFTINGGSITKNSAAWIDGGGVYINSDTLKLKGRVNISGNKGNNKDSNLYLKENCIISVTGAVDSSSCIGVSTENDPVTGTAVPLTLGLSNNGFKKDFLRSDKDGFTVIKKNNEAVLSVFVYEVEIEGNPQHGSVSADKEIAEINDTVTLTVIPDEYCKLSELNVIWVDAQGNSQTITPTPVSVPNPSQYTFIMPAASVKIRAVFGLDYSWAWLSEQVKNGGTVKLLNDISAKEDEDPLIIPSGKDCTLDLNGFCLDCTNVQYRPAVIASDEPAAVIVSGNLTLKDSSADKTGVIKSTDGSFRMSAVRVSKAGSLIQKGGTIQGFTAAFGAGVCLSEGACFTLEEGSISGNKAEGNNGGGVYADKDSRFTMTGGEITGNHAHNGGGVFARGEFFMSGGCISCNKATDVGGGGGGVYISGRVFEMNGGEIRDNTADYGGGVYIGCSSFSMTGGVITKNNAGESGGGVYGYGDESYSCLITMTGGEITDNVIGDGSGGGLYMTSVNSVFKVEGSPVIRKNYDSISREHNIYHEGKHVLVTGAMQNACLCFGYYDNVFTGSILAKGDGYTLKETDLSAFELTDACTGLHPVLEKNSIIVKQTLPDDITLETPVFTGEPLTPGIWIYDDSTSKNLNEGTDYTVNFRDNINAGTGTAVITGIGNYSGTLEKTFTILKSPDVKNLGDVKRSLNHAGESFAFSILPFIPDNTGTVSSCELNGDVGVSGNVTVSDASVSTAGEVTLLLSNGALGDAVTIPVKVTAQNYDLTFNLVCSFIECDHPSDKRERRGVKDNNCSVKGYTGDIYCSLCESLLETGKDIPIDPEKHDFDLENGKIVREATAYSYGGHTYYCRHNGEHTLTVMDIPPLPSKDGTDHTELAEDTKDLSGDAAPKVEEKTNEDGSSQEIVTIGGEKVSDIIITPDGRETVETKVWIGGLQSSYTYTGSTIKPSFHVYDGTRKLAEKTDYTVSWKNNKDAGTATATVKFKGNYKDEKGETVNFKINAAVLGEDIIAREIGVAAKKKGSVKVSPVLTWKDTGKAVSSRYFDITPSTVTGEGTTDATVTVKSGQNNFAGSTAVKIKAVGDRSKLLSNAKVKFNPSSYPYTGSEITPKYELTLGGKTLTEGTDYKRVSLCNNINPGTATVVFEAINGSSAGIVGSKTATFKITGKKELKEGTSFTFSCSESVPYAKGGAKAYVTVTDNDNHAVLTEGRDYTLSYSKNKSLTNGARTAEVKVTGKGNYKSSVTLKFAIEQQSLKTISENIIVSDQFTTKAKLKAPKITITDVDGKKLKSGTDYTVGDTDTSDPANTDTKGIVRVKITGKGAYKNETLTVSYRYEDKIYDISKAKAAGKIADQAYTGNAVKLSNAELTGILIAKDKAGAEVSLVPGVHFTVTGYANNVKNGTAKVTVRGIGDFAGTKTITFKIVQKKVDYKGALVGDGWK